MKIRLLVALGACTLGAGLVTVPAHAAPATLPYVVMVKPGFRPASVAAADGVTPTMVFDALGGFAADLTSAQVKKLTGDAKVQSVQADGLFGTVKPPTEPGTAPWDLPQFTTYGQDRMGLLVSPTAKVDGIDERIDADIAILDSGIYPDHPDLNVVGGVDCVHNKGGKTWEDLDGHGTMVGGFAAALDNSIGTVGVAPGARLWAVRVIKANGVVTDSSALCGFDWVISHADVIDVVNLSFGKYLSNPTAGDGVPCGAPKPSSFHEAICEMVGRGVTVVAAAAGNESRDASMFFPAAYPEVIAVSAVAETDGLPGGLGPDPTCLSGQHDDHLATFTNFGAPVDIAAPGVCVSSTFPPTVKLANGETGWWYAKNNGTSFAAPHVAGAAALYISTHPDATPAQVQAALVAAGEPGPIPGDPDNYPEPLLNVSGL